ncbi:YceI family protein [Sinomonas mesophila]|uniref:YceI family protein n=1 Tax=Sinomonas mesophila TaxID=1531955 RepID=UPI0009855F4B|nr:YceI family protein [Sinomonas mesophila]
MTAAQMPIEGYVAGTWEIDPVHTEIGFSVRHLMLSKVRGRFTRFTGSYTTARNPLNSSATVTVEMTSIDTNNPTRDDDLRSENYFDVDRYPQMTYQSTGVRIEDGQVILDGELTVHGVTRPVPLSVEVNGFGKDPYGNQRSGFTATGSISRADFGMTFNVPLEGGGVLVGDEIDLQLEVEGILQKPGTSD